MNSYKVSIATPYEIEAPSKKAAIEKFLRYLSLGEIDADIFVAEKVVCVQPHTYESHEPPLVTTL